VVPVRDFVTGPFQTVLAVDEIAVEAVVPAPGGDPAGGYLKLERRIGDYATVGVAVAIERSGGKVIKAGIGLTGVGGSTISADEAADLLVGQPLSTEAIGEAAELAASAAEPSSDHRGSASYKRHLVSVFTSRILSGQLGSKEEAA
jgi:carbon-monoxide dehydrogenase medium subunit